MELEDKQLGHYRLRGLLGSGGMGDVYLAEDLTIPRRVAIKVVRGEALINAQANQRALRLFTREMKAIAALDHPHILSVIDFGEETTTTITMTYLVMPYRPEGSLADRLRRQSEQATPTPTLTEIVQLIEQAARALQHAHDHHILHLDVKPSNFLVRELAENPRVPDLLLADFGISRFTMATSSASQSVRGTPTSMAPEHWEGKPVAASDQYGLAIMAYQLLTGQLPFTGTMLQVMFQHFSTPPTPPSHINPALPAEIDTVILQALAKDPSQRFASVAAFAHALQQAVGMGVSVGREMKEGPHSSPHPSSIPPAGTPLQAAQLVRDEQPFTPEKITVTPDIDLNHPQPAQPVPASQPFSPSTGVQAFPGYPWQPSQVGHMQPPLPPRQLINRPRPMLIIALVALIMVLIGGSIGIVAVVRNGQTTATANTVAQNNAQAGVATATANANAQATAQATATANVQAQATAGVIQTATAGQPKYSDPLTAGNVHDTTWTNDGTYCFFASDGYHVHVDTSQATSPHFCTESDRPYQDAAITIAMSIRGGYSGGLLLRLQNSRGYFFEVGIGGNYHIGNWGAPGSLQDWTDSPAIKQGLNSLNTLQVIAHGSDFLFYVNGVYMTQVQDATYGVGDIGFACEANNTTGPGQAVFSNLNVYL